MTLNKPEKAENKQHREIRSYEKHEARNSKYETNPNDQNSKYQTKRFEHLKFKL
jgi:hypothetical protein